MDRVVHLRLGKCRNLRLKAFDLFLGQHVSQGQAMTESRGFSFNFILYEYLQLLPLLPFEQASVAGKSWNRLVAASRNW